MIWLHLFRDWLGRQGIPAGERRRILTLAFLFPLGEADALGGETWPARKRMEPPPSLSLAAWYGGRRGIYVEEPNRR